MASSIKESHGGSETSDEVMCIVSAIDQGKFEKLDVQASDRGFNSGDINPVFESEVLVVKRDREKCGNMNTCSHNETEWKPPLKVKYLN